MIASSFSMALRTANVWRRMSTQYDVVFDHLANATHMTLDVVQALKHIRLISSHWFSFLTHTHPVGVSTQTIASVSREVQDVDGGHMYWAIVGLFPLFPSRGITSVQVQGRSSILEPFA